MSQQTLLVGHSVRVKVTVITMWVASCLFSEIPTWSDSGDPVSRMGPLAMDWLD
ncbi:MAG: hypothetical protein GTN93_34590, partial [Anaerolineae bacterium]|nr:hypothetical protein [Anaerolineae bacterium]